MGAQIVETIKRDGRIIAIYDNGMERDVEAKKIIRPPTSALITKQSSQIMHQKRQEKAARLLRERIRDATSKASTLNIKDSAEAVAETGGILWEEIVLNQDAYHRDRLEAFEKIGRISGVIPNANNRAPEEKQPGGDAVLQFGTELIKVLRAAIELAQPREIIDGTATDTRNEP